MPLKVMLPVLSVISIAIISKVVINKAGSAISNGREPRSCLGRVFKFKLGSLTQ